jgi:predicted nuclease of restriction endonuclease-like (RecB) superfamily
MKDKKEGAAAPKLSSAAFKGWVAELKSRIRQSQLKAAVKVNSELLRLYWTLGRDIVERSLDAAYGSRFFEALSRELRAEFPAMEGFSVTNLRYCKLFYRFYSRDAAIFPRLGDDSLASRNASVRQERHDATAIHQQPVDEFVAEVLLQIPWGHHIAIFSQCSSVAEALFYIRKTVEHGWSRAVLMNFLDAGLFESQGLAANNFTRLLPEPQSELAVETLKDPYNFDFLALSDDYRERELEDALTANVTKFLLELGSGFAFVGR